MDSKWILAVLTAGTRRNKYDYEKKKKNFTVFTEDKKSDPEKLVLWTTSQELIHSNVKTP